MALVRLNSTGLNSTGINSTELNSTGQNSIQAPKLSIIHGLDTIFLSEKTNAQLAYPLVGSTKFAELKTKANLP